jgi:DNA-binding winged helix-turn-helix (wHTH) protein
MQIQSDFKIQNNAAPENSVSLKEQGKRALSFARALLEKCDIQLSKQAYLEALQLGRSLGESDVLSTGSEFKDRSAEGATRSSDHIGLEVEALSGLLRVSAEMEDFSEIQHLRELIEGLIENAPLDALPGAYYCLGVALSYQTDSRSAYRSYRKALKASVALLAVDQSEEVLSEHLKIWVALIHEFIEHEQPRRASYTVDVLLSRYDSLQLKGVNGALNMIKGRLAELDGDLSAAKEWYQKAHADYMRDRNWYSSIYVLYAYARLHRRLRNFTEAYWNLDLAAKAVGAEFLNLKRQLDSERRLLQEDAIDLLIDSRSLIVSTRENAELNLGKQYVLLGILEALSEAHNRSAEDAEHGLSKAEIIERVWKEKYRPEAHDNKLYYNINRLRKLIEPDVRHPRYLLNWKEGYRLAPGMKVHYIKS